MLSEPVLADAGAEDGLAIPEDVPVLAPEAPELAPAGGMVSVLVGGELDGEVEGDVEGDVDGELIDPGAAESVAFLPQAPSASNADKTTADATTDLDGRENIKISFLELEANCLESTREYKN